MTTCTIDGCDLRHHAKGWCVRHYNRNRRHGDPSIVKGNYVAPKLYRTCTLYGCDQPHHAKGFCHSHYEIARRRENGSPPALKGIVREHCEVCGETSMGQGRWCYVHFRAYVREQDRLRPERGNRKTPTRCGTEQGRNRHRRRGEPLCPMCEADATDWLKRMTRAA